MSPPLPPFFRINNCELFRWRFLKEEAFVGSYGIKPAHFKSIQGNWTVNQNRPNKKKTKVFCVKKNEIQGMLSKTSLWSPEANVWWSSGSSTKFCRLKCERTCTWTWQCRLKKVTTKHLISGWTKKLDFDQMVVVSINIQTLFVFAELMEWCLLAISHSLLQPHSVMLPQCFYQLRIL